MTCAAASTISWLIRWGLPPEPRAHRSPFERGTDLDAPAPTVPESRFKASLGLLTCGVNPAQPLRIRSTVGSNEGHDTRVPATVGEGNGRARWQPTPTTRSSSGAGTTDSLSGAYFASRRSSNGRPRGTKQDRGRGGHERTVRGSPRDQRHHLLLCDVADAPHDHRELRLKEFGYDVTPFGPYFQAYPDGRAVTVYPDESQRSYDSIAEFSKRDADTMPKWEAWLQGVADVLGPLMCACHRTSARCIRWICYRRSRSRGRCASSANGAWATSPGCSR